MPQGPRGAHWPAEGGSLAGVDDKLDAVLAPDFVAGLVDLTMDELRARRGLCQSLEGVLSFRRRMAQGRLDIIGAEWRRRETGEESLDAAASVAELPGVLSEGFVQRSGARAAAVIEPDEAAMDTRELDEIVGPGVLGSLAELSDGELQEQIRRLSAYEQDLSERRRVLHERLDAFQAEIARRYQSGEASVDSLLS